MIINSDSDTLYTIAELNLLHDVQALVKKHVPSEVDLVDNLLLDRHKEVAIEKNSSRNK